MAQKVSRFRALMVSAAALSMIATPAMANHNWDWGGRHHRDRVDAGDVLTGILIIGGIAAIASAAGNSKKRQRYERRDERSPDDRDQRDYSRDDRPEWQGQQQDRGSAGGTTGGINGAISRCMSEVSRGSNRVDEIDSVAREGEGWRVMGRTASGNQFSCAVDRDGRIRNVNVDGQAIQ